MKKELLLHSKLVKKITVNTDNIFSKWKEHSSLQTGKEEISMDFVKECPPPTDVKY